MSTVKIHNPVDGQFAMVPNALWALPVSCTAKAIFAFLLSFRDQSTVRVALIESTLKLGRDSRRNAMRELQEHGLIEREITRHNGRIVTDCLVVTTVPLLRDLLGAASPSGGGDRRGPENQAAGGKRHRGPELPAGGKSTPTGADIRPTRGGKSGPLFNTNIKPGARRAGSVSISGLSSFQRSRIMSGQSVLIEGETVQAGSPEMQALCALLRCNAGEG